MPAVSDANRLCSPVDAFVLARVESKGLQPAPEAGKATLLRRLSLDLIGLPPTIEEVDAFVRDKRPDAYERQVELRRVPGTGFLIFFVFDFFVFASSCNAVSRRGGGGAVPDLSTRDLPLSHSGFACV